MREKQKRHSYHIAAMYTAYYIQNIQTHGRFFAEKYKNLKIYTVELAIKIVYMPMSYKAFENIML